MATPAKIIDQKLPTIALVGRVNVGKSTLFNILGGEWYIDTYFSTGESKKEIVDIVIFGSSDRKEVQ